MQPFNLNSMYQNGTAKIFELAGKIIIITGGTGVIGSSFVKALGHAGAKMVVIGRKEDVGNQLVREVKQDGGEAVFIKCDVLNTDDLYAAAEKVTSTYGRIDALVNAAGGNIAGAVINPEDDIFEMNLDALHDVFELNLFGTIMPTVIFGKYMAKHGGSIVNISSMA